MPRHYSKRVPQLDGLSFGVEVSWEGFCFRAVLEGFAVARYGNCSVLVCPQHEAVHGTIPPESFFARVTVRIVATDLHDRNLWTHCTEEFLRA